MNKFFLTIIGITITLVSLLFFNIDEVKAWDDNIVEHWNFDNGSNDSEIYNLQWNENFSRILDEKYTGGYAQTQRYGSPTNTNFEMTGFNENGASLSYWIKTEDYTRSELAIEKDTSNKFFYIKLGSQQCQLVEAYETFNAIESLDCSGIDWTEWTHIVITGDTTNIKIYANNNLIGNYSYDSPISNYNFLNPAKIYFLEANGYSTIDEITIFKKTLTTDNINFLYTLNRPLDTNDNLDEITSNDYVYYYGENPLILKIDETKEIKYAYNICDTYDTNNVIKAYILDETDTIINEHALIGGCKDFLDIEYASSTEFDKTFSIKIESYEDWLSQDTPINTWESNTFDIIVAEQQEIENLMTFIDYNFDDIQTFDVYNQTATSTLLNFSYNMCENEDFANATNTKMYLYNMTAGNKTDISSELLTNCADTIDIIFPLATGAIDPQTFSAGIYNDNFANDIIYLNPFNRFTIGFYNTKPPLTIDDITSTSTYISIFDMDIKELVCSEAQWESSNILTTAYCNILKTTLDIPIRGLTWAKTELVNLYNQTKLIPPFKYIFELKDYWDNSEPNIGINTLLGIKTANAQELNSITIPEKGAGWTLNFPLAGENVEMRLFNETDMRTMLGNNTINILRIFGNIAGISLTFMYLFARIKNYNF